MDSKKSKSFQEWTQDQLEFAFGVERILQSTPEMKIWEDRAKKVVISEEEKIQLQELHNIAIEDLDGWNELELRENLIVHLVSMVNFRLLQYKANKFSGRFISAIINGFKLHGFVDWMVATGKKNPIEPFFFIHEYKHETGGNNDVRGQLVATMFAAQQLNKKPPTPNLFKPNPKHYYLDMPVYGAFVIGNRWYFVSLKDTTYYITKDYSIFDLKDFHYIFQMLKAQREMIVERLTKVNKK